MCPNCGYHLRMDAWERINYLADKNSFTELYQNLSSNNPIEIDGYVEKLQAAKEKTSLEDVITLLNNDSDETIYIVMDINNKLKHTNYPIVDKKNRCLGLLRITDLSEKNPNYVTRSNNEHGNCFSHSVC